MLAQKLVGLGKRLLLQNGDFLPHETENWDATTVFAKNNYSVMQRWYDGKGNPFQMGRFQCLTSLYEIY